MTSPAETILRNPTFLEEFEDAAPPAQKKGLLRTLMGSRALPMIGRVLGPVGVAFAAYEVCNVVMDGCLSFVDDGGVDEGTGMWIWSNRGFEAAGIKTSPMVFYYQEGAANYETPAGHYPEDCSAALAAPKGTTGAALGVKGGENYCGPEIGYVVGGQSIPTRSPGGYRVDYGGEVGSAHSGPDYCRGWGASDACQSSPDSEGWSAAAATGLKEHVDPEVGQWVASKIEGSEVVDPYVTEVELPDCVGVPWTTCRDTLEELELVPERVELDWQTADIELAPDTVVQTEPLPGVELETGTKVTVTTNPDEAGMPLIIPTPEPGETYDEYVARLSPGLNPSRSNVSPEFTDPSVGPNGVLRVIPQPGTRANPESETEVEVQTNPADAPAPSGSSWTAPAIPPLDLSPLAGVTIGCNDFPFGIFCWIGDGLTSWGASGQCPDVDVPLGSSAGVESGLPFDFCQFEPAMEVIRPILVLLAGFTLAYMFAAAAMGFGGSGSED